MGEILYKAGGERSTFNILSCFSKIQEEEHFFLSTYITLIVPLS